MNTEIKRFNLRVYALIIRGTDILLSEETLNGFSFTKFPGGGVELGEGISEALARELREEGNIEVLSAEHFYTTDFFQQSAFNPEEQVVSVYFRVESDIEWNEFTSDQSSPGRSHTLRLYFYPLSNLKLEKLTFPIDKLMVEKLISRK